MNSRGATRWALIGLFVHVLLTAAFLARAGGNPQYFVHFGEDAAVISFAQHVLGKDLLIPHTDGHDGQAFWLLARDPLLLEGKAVLASSLDRPAYRAQRILYPALAAPWRFAGETGLLWGLLATNLAVVFGGGRLAAALANELRAAGRASLSFALNPGVILATLFSLADALALALLLAATLALMRRRFALAVACGALGVLTKESTLIGLAGFALLAPRLPTRWRVLLVLIPAGAATAWALYVRWRLGWPAAQIQEFDLPFRGYLEAWQRGWSPIGNWYDAVPAFALLPLAALGLLRWHRRRSLILAGGVPFLALVPFLSAQVLDLSGNSLRVLAPSLTLIILDYFAELGGEARALPRLEAAPSLPVDS